MKRISIYQQDKNAYDYASLSKIAVIPFQSFPNAEDVADGFDEPFDWFDLRYFPDELSRLIDPNETVLSVTHATMLLDYPMSVVVTRRISADNSKSFSRQELLQALNQLYLDVYQIEEDSMSKEALEPSDAMSLNRPESDGKIGISGHILNDLGVSTIEVFKSGDETVLIPVMES